MATVVNPPRNGLHSATLARGTAAGPSSPGNTQSKALQNPLMAGALGDPSLNQNFGGGILGGVMQGLQAREQHKAFVQQQQALSDAMDHLTQATNGSAHAVDGYSQWVKEHPKDLITLTQAGIKPHELLQSMMVGQPGQVQQQDLGGGAKLVSGYDNTGKFFHNIVQPHNTPSEAVHPIGVDPQGNVVVSGRGGGTQSVPGVRPTSVVNNENSQAHADARATNTAAATQGRFDTTHPTDATTGQPIVKLTPQEIGLFNNSSQAFQALATMNKLAPDVTGLLTNKLATFVGGKVTGEDPKAIAFNAAKLSFENAISQRDVSNLYTTIKEQLKNTPPEWLSSGQYQADTAQWAKDIQGKVQNYAGAKEATGILPVAIAQSAASVGVFTKQFAPTIQKLRTNPDGLTQDEVTSLGYIGSSLSPADKALARQVGQRHMTSQAAFANPQTPQAQQQQQTPVQQGQPQPQPQQGMQQTQAPAPMKPPTGEIPITPAGPGSPNPTRNFTPPPGVPDVLSPAPQAPGTNPIKPGNPLPSAPNASQLQQNQRELQQEIAGSPNG